MSEITILDHLPECFSKAYYVDTPTIYIDSDYIKRWATTVVFLENEPMRQAYDLLRKNGIESYPFSNQDHGALAIFLIRKGEPDFTSPEKVIFTAEDGVQQNIDVACDANIVSFENHYGNYLPAAANIDEAIENLGGTPQSKKEWEMDSWV